MHQLALTKQNDRQPLRSFPVVASLNSRSLSSPLSGMVHRKSDCACGGGCPRCQEESHHPGIQTKLAISTPGDSYEQEADRVADQVLAAPAPSVVIGAAPLIQRFMGQPTGAREMAPASVGQVLASSGSPLEPALRHDMEQRFGHDFSRVRVHGDGAAQQSAREVNAKAYTVGQDIAFGAGQFAPGTHAGRHLLAHELTHVVQQSAGTGTIRREVDLKDFEAPEFSDEVLDDYLSKFGPDNIEDTSDSDDKARTLVRRILDGKWSPPGADKLILMIREMQKGYTGDDDEHAILNILVNCEKGAAGWPKLADLFAPGSGLDPKKVDSDFDGEEEDYLRALYDRNFEGGRKKALEGSRKLKSEAIKPKAEASQQSTLDASAGDSESADWAQAAEKLKLNFRGAADAAERSKLKAEVISLADGLINSLIETKKAAKPNAARLDNLREALKHLTEALGDDRVMDLDAIAGIAYRSQDAKVREATINTLAKDSTGVEGQQRFLRRIATVVGKELPEGSEAKSREWLEANTEAIGAVIAELGKSGIAGQGGEGFTPRSLELSSQLLKQYTRHENDAPFDAGGKLTGTNVDAKSRKIQLDCDGYATYVARLLRGQGWETVGYMLISPLEKKVDKPTANRDAHAVALARKGALYLGVSNAEIKELGGHGKELDLDGAKDALWSLALEAYAPALHKYDVYYFDAKPGGAYDSRILNPAEHGVTPYKSARL